MQRKFNKFKTILKEQASHCHRFELHLVHRNRKKNSSHRAKKLKAKGEKQTEKQHQRKTPHTPMVTTPPGNQNKATLENFKTNSKSAVVFRSAINDPIIV